MKSKIGIIGLGNYGYGLLYFLDQNIDKNKYEIFGYEKNQEVLENFIANHSHPFIQTDFKLSDDVNFFTSTEGFRELDVLIIAIPSEFTESLFQEIREHLKPGAIILNTAKALDITTGGLLSDTVSKRLSGIDYKYAVISGGTIASDLFIDQPLGVDIASEQDDTLDLLCDIFDSEHLYVNRTYDVVGVQLAGAYKNIVSLLAGIMKGMGFSYGSETRLISLLSSEVAEKCIELYGCDPRTFSMKSQSWGNDLWMSCTGNTRNRKIGIAIGESESAEAALSHLSGQDLTVEGLRTLESFTNRPKFLEINDIKALYDYLITKTISREELIQELVKV